MRLALIYLGSTIHVSASTSANVKVARRRGRTSRSPRAPAPPVGTTQEEAFTISHKAQLQRLRGSRWDKVSSLSKCRTPVKIKAGRQGTRAKYRTVI